jgi:hypothetical protein
MNEHHYLGFKRLSGEVLKYVVEMDGEWVALLGWGSAAFKCTARDKWIGWRSDQQWKRLKYIANNQRFLILPWIRITNLAVLNNEKYRIKRQIFHKELPEKFPADKIKSVSLDSWQNQIQGETLFNIKSN